MKRENSKGEKASRSKIIKVGIEKKKEEKMKIAEGVTRRKVFASNNMLWYINGLLLKVVSTAYWFSLVR